MRRGLVILLLLSVSGCSWLGLGGEKGQFRDRTDDYRKAKIEPRIKVPPTLDDDKLQDIYVIPQITEDLKVAGQFEVPRPSPLVARESEELVRIQRLGDEEWVLAAVAPGQLWPQVRAFLTNNAIQVARVDARLGIIETGWFLGTDATMEERYQFRIEQGVQRNTSELHVLQMFQAGDISSWPDNSADSERSSRMLLALAQYVASSTDTAPVSMMAAQAISAGGKVTLQEDAEGMPYIWLQLPYYRAWASVERALRESSFTVRDLDRSNGLFYIRFVPPEDEGNGWFDWLFGEDEATAEAIGDQDYVLKVAEGGEGEALITLRREDGVPLEIAQAQALLSLIKGNIN